MIKKNIETFHSYVLKSDWIMNSIYYESNWEQQTIELMKPKKSETEAVEILKWRSINVSSLFYRHLVDSLHPTIW